MFYQELSPHPELSRFVVCYWFLRDESPEVAESRVEEVVPDGSPEIVINLADRFCQFDAHGHRELQPRVLVAGQMSRCLRIAPTGVIELVGIRFRPAGLYPFLGGTSLEALNESRIDLDSIDRRLSRALATAASAESDTARIRQIERVLYARWVHTQASTAEAAVGRILSTKGALKIGDLFHRESARRRLLQRHFRREVGISPKLLARIVRFQHVIHRIETEPWAQLALQCGYFDQSHLILDFRAFTGKSPRAWFASENMLSKMFAGW